MRYPQRLWALGLALPVTLGCAPRDTPASCTVQQADGAAVMTCGTSTTAFNPPDVSSAVPDGGDRGCTVATTAQGAVLRCPGQPDIPLDAADGGPVSCNVQAVQGQAVLVCPDGTQVTLAGPDGGPAPPDVTLAGTVELLGAAVHGNVTVTVDGAGGAVTDAAGAFAINALPLGNHRVRLASPDYEPVEFDVAALPPVTILPRVTLRAARILTGLDGLHPLAATADGSRVLLGLPNNFVAPKPLWLLDPSDGSRELVDEATDEPALVLPDWVAFTDTTRDLYSAGRVVLHRISTGARVVVGEVVLRYLPIPGNPAQLLASVADTPLRLRWLDLEMGVTRERTVSTSAGYLPLDAHPSRVFFAEGVTVSAWAFADDSTVTWTVPADAWSVLGLGSGDRALAFAGSSYASDLYFLDAAGGATRIAQKAGAVTLSADRQHAFWKETPSYGMPGPVRHLDASTGTVTMLAPAAESMGALVSGETELLVTEQGGSLGQRLTAVPVAGGPARTLLEDVRVTASEASPDGHWAVVSSSPRTTSGGGLTVTLINVATATRRVLGISGGGCLASGPAAAYSDDGSSVLVRVPGTGSSGMGTLVVLDLAGNTVLWEAQTAAVCTVRSLAGGRYVLATRKRPDTALEQWLWRRSDGVELLLGYGALMTAVEVPGALYATMTPKENSRVPPESEFRIHVVRLP